jgi:hypothetical protein
VIPADDLNHIYLPREDVARAHGGAHREDPGADEDPAAAAEALKVSCDTISRRHTSTALSLARPA